MKGMLAFALLAMGIPALAQEALFTGAGLLKTCEQAERVMNVEPTNNENQLDAGICLGYVIGMRVGLVFGEIAQAGPQFKALFCPPAGVSNGELVRVALQGLRASPEKLHESAAIVVATSFYDAYPCR